MPPRRNTMTTQTRTGAVQRRNPGRPGRACATPPPMPRVTHQADPGQGHQPAAQPHVAPSHTSLPAHSNSGCARRSGGHAHNVRRMVGRHGGGPGSSHHQPHIQSSAIPNPGIAGAAQLTVLTVNSYYGPMGKRSQPSLWSTPYRRPLLPYPPQVQHGLPRVG